MTFALADINAMSAAGFISAFGDVAEHSPWVAERAAVLRPFPSREAMIDGFSTVLRAASHDVQLTLIRAHPDLATRAKLTADSSHEQAGAGLGSLTKEEFVRFSDLNSRYKEKFGFPFIFAVKGATKEQILTSFETRIHHLPETEFETALDNICRIFRFRIEERVSQ